MHVLLIEAHAAPKEITVDCELKAMEKVVGGPIEAAYPFEDKVAIICNTDAKTNNVEYNRALRDEDGDIYDVIAGPFLIAGITSNSFCSLTKKQLDTYRDMFSTPERFEREKERITVIKEKAIK